MQAPCFRSAPWDVHPGSPEIQQCFSVSQQPWTGNQQMQNELHICLEDICFGPAFTRLFLIIYLSPEKESVLFKGWRPILLTLNQNPNLMMGSWRAGHGVEWWDAQDRAQIFTRCRVRWFPWPSEKKKFTFFLFFFFSISSNDLYFLPCISDLSSCLTQCNSSCLLPASLQHHIDNCISISTVFKFLWRRVAKCS